jgi:DNA-binding HxlR family transcriptional regulator
VGQVAQQKPRCDRQTQARSQTRHRGRVAGAPATGSLPGCEHNQLTPLARALLATGDQWTLLIVNALAAESLRLNELRLRLPGISAGVLDRYLQQMVSRGLVARRRYRELPPRVEYQLSKAGEELIPVALQLADWGTRHPSSAPAKVSRSSSRES